MCGIAGYIGKNPINKQKIINTLELMKNRGPDHRDYRLFKKNNTHIYLLHSRLSIIDLDIRSNQPFIFKNYTLVFNGEIYNYIEVRKELEKLGHTFATDSDTEVLLKAYIEYGEDCVNKFNGMWAFAIWDENKQKLFLSRDRFSEKPLYYFKDISGFYFASEVKAIQSLLENKLEVDHDFLKRYLIYGYKSIYKTPQTYFKNIRELSYASNMSINLNNDIEEYRYWFPEHKESKMKLDDAIEGTRHHLLKSVELRLRADVPIAFCLSGGIDSSGLVSIAKKAFDYDVATFSIIDSDERYNEAVNIEATINDLNCKNHLVNLKYDNMLKRLTDLIKYHDSPISTITYLVHSMLSEKISREGYKISVSGTSADELFTGYYDHFNLHLYEMRNNKNFNKYLNDWKKYPGKFVRNPYLVDPKLYFKDQNIRDHNYLNSDDFLSYLTEPFLIEITEENYSDSLLRNRMLNELFHEATPVILHEDDHNSMLFSIENRSPYLDVELFNFAYSIPNDLLIHNGYGKYILRESLKGILNDQVRLDRKKKGFNVSIESLFNFDDKKTLEFFLDDSPIFEFVNRNKIETLLKNKNFKNSYKKFIFNFINSKIFMENYS